MKIGVDDELQREKINHDGALIDSQKLVCRSSHVDTVVRAFLPFTIKKPEYWIVNGRMLDDSGHDLKECLAESGRAALGNMPVPITINLDRKAGQPVRLSFRLMPKLQ